MVPNDKTQKMYPFTVTQFVLARYCKLKSVSSLLVLNVGWRSIKSSVAAIRASILRFGPVYFDSVKQTIRLYSISR